MKKLLNFTVVKIGNDWHPIVDLVSETVGCIVNYQYIFYFDAFKDSQVFYKNPIWRFCAVFSVEPEGNKFFVRIKDVQHHISVCMMRCCEHNNFIDLSSSFQALLGIRSDIYSSCNNDARLKINSNLVMGRGLGVTDTVDQCLIKIKYNHFLSIICSR